MEREQNLNSFKEKAEALIAEIPDFNEMTSDEKIEALKGLIDTLADRSRSNFIFKENIGIAKEIEKAFLRIGEEKRHQLRMTELGVAA